MKQIITDEVPDNAEDDAIYVVSPKHADDAFYQQRTCRHLGWISEEEQWLLKNATVGIAGLGGMGGSIAPTLLRAGVGNLKLADNDIFDISNINRQFGATRHSVGKSKTFETAKSLRAIVDDTTIICYPRGINSEEVELFVENCDIIIDALEFWAVAARILLHKEARRQGKIVFNVCPVGFGLRLFVFSPQSVDIESFMGMSYEEALKYEEKVKNSNINECEKKQIISRVVSSFIPSPPRYADESQEASNIKAISQRVLHKESGAPVLATNIAFATGFLSNHILLQLVKSSNVQRRYIKQLPYAPSYIYFDAAKLKMQVRTCQIFEKGRKFFLQKLLKKIR